MVGGLAVCPVDARGDEHVGGIIGLDLCAPVEESGKSWKVLSDAGHLASSGLAFRQLAEAARTPLADLSTTSMRLWLFNFLPQSKD